MKRAADFGIADPSGREAVRWMAAMASGTLTREEADAFERWRTSDDSNACAWAKMVGAMGPFDVIARSGMCARAIADSLPQTAFDRRKVLTGFVAVTGSLGLGSGVCDRFVPISDLLSDQVTRTGEQRRLVLDDGSTVTMGPRSAIDLDFDFQRRGLRLLEGRLFLEANAEERLFEVDVNGVKLQTRSGRFVIDRNPSGAVVLDAGGSGSVQRDGDDEVRLDVGDQITFAGGSHTRERVDVQSGIAWTQGLIVARDMRLADIVERFRPYFAGIIRVDPSVMERHATVVLKLFDPVASLATLADSLGCRMANMGGVYVSIGPAGA